MKDSVIIESQLEFDEKEIETLEVDTCGLAEAQLTTKQRKALPDSSFAVVVTVKNKKTGEPRKIRKYPINDKAHVRNALARLGQDAPKKELIRLGISVKSVIKKVLRRAKEIGMKDLLKRRGLKGSSIRKFLNRKVIRKAIGKIRKLKKDYEISEASLENHKVKKEKFVKGIKKFASEIKKLRVKGKESSLSIAFLKKEVKETKDFYIVNAKEVIKRREELGDFAKDLKDSDLINDTKYELAKARKIITEKEKDEKKVELSIASVNIGDKDEITAKEKEFEKNRGIVNQKAFGHLLKKDNK